MKTRKLAAVFFLLCMLSCSYDSEDDFVETTEDPIDDPIDDPSDQGITYDDDIASIMANSCVSCHSSPPTNGAPFALVNYTQVSQRAGSILNRMSLQSGAAGAMPPSGRLPQSTIDLIDQWIEDGLLEN